MRLFWHMARRGSVRRLVVCGGMMLAAGSIWTLDRTAPVAAAQQSGATQPAATQPADSASMDEKLLDVLRLLIEKHRNTAEGQSPANQSAPQPPQASPQAMPRGPEGEVLPSPPGGRDPFSTTQRMEEESQRRVGTASGLPNIPAMRLRGVADDGENPAIALLQIENSDVYVVRQNDTVNVLIGGRATTLVIEDVKNSTALVRIGMIPEPILVR